MDIEGECTDHLARQKQFREFSRRMENKNTGILKVKKLSSDAIIPTQSNSSDAGWDLYALEHRYVPSNRRALIKTGISLEIPDGFVGLIWPRSGLAVKKGIDVFAGVVDAGYRGDVGVCLYNSSQTEFQVQAGDRIAQIIFQPVSQFRLSESNNLQDSSRGGEGFGSTGR